MCNSFTVNLRNGTYSNTHGTLTHSQLLKYENTLTNEKTEKKTEKKKNENIQKEEKRMEIDKKKTYCTKSK